MVMVAAERWLAVAALALEEDVMAQVAVVTVQAAVGTVMVEERRVRAEAVMVPAEGVTVLEVVAMGLVVVVRARAEVVMGLEGAATVPAAMVQEVAAMWRRRWRRWCGWRRGRSRRR